MAHVFANRVAVAIATTGTGTLTLGSAIGANFLAPVDVASLADGDDVTYLLTDGSNYEIGRGELGSSKTTLTRDVVEESLISGTSGTTKLTLSGSATLRVIASAADFNDFLRKEGDGSGLTGITYRGHVFGLELSNNTTDATNDIDIDAGEAASDNEMPELLVLASSITKRLDAAWEAGTGNGGLDTGSITNTTYHVWLIGRSDTGAVDALFSTSATSPTMPANYDLKCRIGRIIRSDGAIRPFFQRGDRFTYRTPVYVSETIGTAAGLVTLPVPIGTELLAHLTFVFTGVGTAYISSPSQTDIAPAATGASPLHSAQSVSGIVLPFNKDVLTDASGRVRARASTSGSLQCVVDGWTEPRGRAQ